MVGAAVKARNPAQKNARNVMIPLHAGKKALVVMELAAGMNLLLYACLLQALETWKSAGTE
jgi:hypothetical protein